MDLQNKTAFLNSKPQELALTGRVADWLESPESRLPVSCTVLSVEDSMEGRSGIEDSWAYTSHGLRTAAGVAIDLSKLRPQDTDNGKGLVSSGSVYFAEIYSKLNEILRRGGIFKNGAVTLFLDHKHGDAEAYLNATSKQLPWAKKAMYVDESVKDNPLLPLIAEKVHNGTLWLAKKQYDANGNRLFSNVCQEVLLPSRGTCLIANVNLGDCVKLSDIPKIFSDSMVWLCKLHPLTGVGNKNHYLKPENDKQVALGVLGLANLLGQFNVTYAQFVEDLENVLLGNDINENSVALWIFRAYQSAGAAARSYKMDRAFCVAPTANSSYRYTDAQGFTTAPEISPPIALEVDRDSEVLGVDSYEYHPNSEIAKEVGWKVQWRLLNAWQRMMDRTGVAHAISANIWSQQVVTPEWITEVFMPSDIKTTYYRIGVDTEALDKSEVVTPESSDEKFADLYAEEEPQVCTLDAMSDPNYCQACGG